MTEIKSPVQQMRTLSRVVLLCILAAVVFLVFRGHHTDFTARARKPVLELPIDKLLETNAYEGPLAKKYPNQLFRLDGQVTSVLDVRQKGRYGLEQSVGMALLITPTPDTGSYMALFYEEETPKLKAVHPGFHVVFLCDRLNTNAGQRMEGCTLERSDAPDTSAG